MADSDLTCSSLSATSGVGQTILSWEVIDPAPGRPKYLAYAKTEIYAATTNNRALATKVGEDQRSFTHGGVPEGETRFYWVRPVNAAGIPGEFFPVSATAGIASTAGTSQPAPGSITEVELAPGAVTPPAIANQAVIREKLGLSAVGGAQVGPQELEGLHLKFATITSAHIVSLQANKIVATSLSAISANLGTVTAGTISGVTINGGTINGGVINAPTINGGYLDVTDVTGDNVIGFRMRTQIVGARIDMQGAELKIWNSIGTNTIRLGTASYTSTPPMAVTATQSGAFAATFSNSAAGSVGSSSPTWAFYASAGAYGPFTGAHDALWPKDVPLPEIGDLIADDGIMFRLGASNTLGRAKMAVKGKPALGVFVAALRLTRTAAMDAGIPESEIRALRRKYHLILVNALGEGQMNVCNEGGDIEDGDLLMPSSTPGKAMRQADDFVRASTVARSRESVIWDDSGRALCPVVYMSG